MKLEACDGLSRRLCFGEQKASLNPLSTPHDLMIEFMGLILACPAEFTLCNSKCCLGFIRKSTKLPWSFLLCPLPQLHATKTIIMNLIHIFTILTLILLSECIQFEIPKVADIVVEILNEYDDYVNYNGSSIEDAAFTVEGAVSKFSARQSTAYWYEQIPHRGISAFGPAGYQVYRNVKDYGARGMSSFICYETITQTLQATA